MCVLVDDPCLWSATRQVHAIRNGELTCSDLLERYLARIERINPDLNAVVTQDIDSASAGATEADAADVRGEELGPLHGLPITIKDA